MQRLCLGINRILLVVLATGLVVTIGCGGGVSTSTNVQSSILNQASEISLAPASLNFGTVVVGTQSSQTVTLTNSGGAVLNIAAITAAANFAQTNNCGSQVSAGGNCQIVVSFSPTAAGTQNGTLTITDNAAGSPQSVPLAGTAVAQGQLAVTPSSISLGNTLVGNTSTQNVQLINTTTASITISSASTSGPGFAVSGLALPLALTSNQTLNFTVTFTPSNSGTASGTVQLTNSGPVSPLVIPLSGTGVTSTSYSVSLSWNPSTSSVIGYNVYRSTQSGGPYSVLNSAPVTDTTFTDASVALGQTYYYVVTSVASGDVQSGYSNQASAVIPAS